MHGWDVSREQQQEIKIPSKIVMALDIFSPESVDMMNTKPDSKANTTLGRIKLNT